VLKNTYIDKNAVPSEDERVDTPEPSELEGLPVLRSELPTRWYDALARYEAEVRQFPHLTREQEVELAKRLRDEGDKEAAWQLVTSNLSLVVKVAKDYRWAKVSLLDLIQEGNVGLMQAVRKFDPTKGVRLASYGTWWIRAYILKYLLNNWHIVKTLTTQQQKLLFFKLRKEKERLKVLGFDPTPKLLAENLDTTEEQVEKVEKLLQVQDVSLDAPLFDEPGVSLIDTMTDDQSFEEDIAEQDFRAILMRKVEEIAKTLTDKEKAILYDRILADEPQTLQAIAERFDLSRERIRQIEKRLLRKMKRLLSQEVPELGEIAESLSSFS
jgi:RNA polymerase sigma-32 factor